MAMKWPVLVLSLFLVLFFVVGVNADIVPLVKLLFNDSNATSTVNLGSLGGIQNLPTTNGGKYTSNAVSGSGVIFSSLKYWRQTGDSTPTYATYTIPKMSAVTVAFWYKATQRAGYRNIYNGNGGPFTASDNGGTLMLYGPGHGLATVTGAFPLNVWKHVAICYDSAGPTKVYDTSGTLKVYLDGQPATVTGSWTGQVAASSVGFTIGQGGGGAVLPFYGNLDNFFIFDKALMQSAVQSLRTTNTVPNPTTCAEVKVYGFLSQADLNEDCSVDLVDFAILAENWTLCTDDSDISCNGLDLPWINNTYGSEDVVLPGFEPLTASSSDVSMWGRVYHFDGASLPTQINNQGVDMLARPINWFLTSGTSTYSLAAGTSTLQTSSSTKAVYQTTGTLGGFSVTGNVLVEYDGFMKFDMVFTPSGSVQANKLYMDIPFVPSSAANMFYPTRRSGAWDGTWHNKFDLCYTNIISVGTPDICLQWLTESDQYFYPRGDAYAIQTLTNVNGANVLRINVINSTKTITSPFKLTFALHAGPVKARRTDWRGWSMSQVKYDLDPDLSNLVNYEYDWWDRAPGEPIPRGGFPAEAGNYFEGKIKYVSAHFAGVRSFDETDCDKRSPEWQRHGSEWLRYPTIWEDQGCPGWFNAYVDTNSSWSQWHVYNVYKLFSLTGMRGLYYDDWRNGPSTNEAAGSGYIDEQGVRQPTNPIFSQRELHRRVYAIVHKYRPDDGVVFIHTASTIMLPVASFCDVIYDGEIMIWTDMVPPSGDYFQTYTNSLFQVIFQCRQYGQIPGFHDMTREQLRAYPGIVGPNYLDLSNQRKLWAILLTHDIHMVGAFSSGLENTYLYPWLHSFGIADLNVVFHPYWEADPAVEIVVGQEPESHLWTSAYSKPGKVMVIVVRDAPNNYTGSLNIQVELDRAKLGLPAGNLICTSLESLGTTSLGTVVGNILTVPVEANNFAGVIIQPE